MMDALSASVLTCGLGAHGSGLIETDSLSFICDLSRQIVKVSTNDGRFLVHWFGLVF